MKKRIMAVLCALLLAVQMAAPPARAAGYLCFVAIGENILPMTDDTMPFWNNGYLYVAGSSFAGAARDSLNIGRIASSDQVLLYSIGQRGTLRFDKDKAYAYDADGEIYYPGGLQRNGQMYVPAAVVAKYFNLQYSVTNVRLAVDDQPIQGDVAWIRQPGSVLTEQMFVNAATFTIVGRYKDYLQEKEQQTQPDSQEPAEDGGVEVDGKAIHLCLTAGEDTAALLDVLDSYQAQASFFCTVDFLEAQGDLLRRMAATGQSIGILVETGSGARPVEEQLAAGNRALERATCGKTRLAYLPEGGEQDLQTARAAGYRCLTADMDRSAYGLYSASGAATLLQRVSQRRGSVTLWLGGSVSSVGLGAFLRAAEGAEGRCLAWTETA